MAHMGGTRRKKQKANADAANGWMLVVEGGTQRKRRTEKRLQPTPTGGVDNRREQQAREGKSRTRKDWTGLMSSDSGSRERASSNCS